LIVELASLQTDADRTGEFEKALSAGRAVLARAQGHISNQLMASIERPGAFVIAVQWSTLEDHTERFVGSELFDEFRAIVGSFLVEAPVVQHFRLPGDPVTFES